MMPVLPIYFSTFGQMGMGIEGIPPPPPPPPPPISSELPCLHQNRLLFFREFDFIFGKYSLALKKKFEKIAVCFSSFSFNLVKSVTVKPIF